LFEIRDNCLWINEIFLLDKHKIDIKYIQHKTKLSKDIINLVFVPFSDSHRHKLDILRHYIDIVFNYMVVESVS
jgi:hypothetical protein